MTKAHCGSVCVTRALDDREMSGALHRSPKKQRLSWKLQKRRLQFQLLTNFGKELPASDDVYEQHEQRFLGLLQKLLEIRKSLEHYRIKALPEYCTACATLGADVWCVVSVGAVGKGVEAEKFRHAMCAINETKEMKSHYFNADEVLSGAVRFLDIHINAMKSVKSQIENRKRLKLEYDCYERKVARLMARKSVSAKLMDRNRIKLENAREALQTVTFDLYRVYAKYESERDTMLNGELEMVRQVMHGFYAKNAEATNFVIPEEIDRSAVEERTDQLFKQMIAKELEKDPSRGSGVSSTPTAPTAIALDILQPPTTVCSPPTPPKSQNPTGFAEPQQSPEQPTTPAEPKEATETPPPPPMPSRPSVDDDLSEKLRTIQLSRPKMPQLGRFKVKKANNQMDR